MEIFQIINLKQTAYNLRTDRGKLYIVHRKENSDMHVIISIITFMFKIEHTTLHISTVFGEKPFFKYKIM